MLPDEADVKDDEADDAEDAAEDDIDDAEDEAEDEDDADDAEDAAEDDIDDADIDVEFGWLMHPFKSLHTSIKKSTTSYIVLPTAVNKWPVSNNVETKVEIAIFATSSA